MIRSCSMINNKTVKCLNLSRLLRISIKREYNLIKYQGTKEPEVLHIRTVYRSTVLYFFTRVGDFINIMKTTLVYILIVKKLMFELKVSSN